MRPRSRTRERVSSIKESLAEGERWVVRVERGEERVVVGVREKEMGLFVVVVVVEVEEGVEG